MTVPPAPLSYRDCPFTPSIRPARPSGVRAVFSSNWNLHLTHKLGRLRGVERPRGPCADPNEAAKSKEGRALEDRSALLSEAEAARFKERNATTGHRFAVTRWRSEVNSNCRYRFVNSQTTASG